ncbi:15329_t:CDS:2, partial [Cetraspora pellucida]
EERIKELEQTQPGTNDFNHIRDGIHDEPLTLNIQHNEKLKSLSNEQYDKISKKIPEIDSATPLNDGRHIDTSIQELKNENLSGDRNVDTLQQQRRGRYQLIEKESEIARYDRYKRQITNFYNNDQVFQLSNENKNKNDLINLRKHRFNTLLYDTIEREMKEDNDKQSFEDGEKYDLLIQTLEQTFLDSPRTVEQLQELRKQLFAIDNVNDAFELLFDEKQKHMNKVSCLIKELLLGYIQIFPYGAYIETLQDGDYFDTEINKLVNQNERDVLQKLRKRTAEIYKDNDKDQYFIDKYDKQFHSICIVEDVNEFVDKIIKKHYLFKIIKTIFDNEDDVITISKMVEQKDNERTFFKKIRPFVKDQTYLNKIDKILRKDDLDLLDKKKQKRRKLKHIKEDVNALIPKTRPIYMKGSNEIINIPICIEAILNIYKVIVSATDDEIGALRSQLLNEIIKYPDPSFFNRYTSKTYRDNEFFINLNKITKQHFLDIVYRILVNRDKYLRLDEKIENIFDDLEV